METIRSLMTLAAFATFLGIVWWAYAPARKSRFDDQARSILEESDE
ncbi:MAG: cbb3-type cytochrome c oxidase subunit 3 [Betaproteobacteria bacterium]|nr:cbb3-type cytochrome c oxidase subunit 3 [Betaproteobacteria bacterium]